jgi:hypothetical protein
VSDVRGKCTTCDHVWRIAKLPVEVSKFAALAKHAGCPACGKKNPNVTLDPLCPLDCLHGTDEAEVR